MENIINIIYNKNIKFIRLADKIIYNFHIQNYDTALRTTTTVINELTTHLEALLSGASYFNEECPLIDQQVIINMLNSLLDALENKDYILLADLFEIQLIPFLIHLQEVVIAKEEYLFDDKRYQSNLLVMKERDSKLASDIEAMPNPIELFDHGYMIEYTSCGLMTLAIENMDNKFYMHSNNRIHNEAFSLASSWYSDEKTEYIIYGLGLGYHIEALSEIDSNIIIKVYESDLNIIKLACAFSDLKGIIKNSNIQIIYDPCFKELSESICNLTENGKFVIHYPSLRNIKDLAIKEKLDNYFIQYSSIENQQRLLNGNFRENILLHSGLVDELKDEFEGKDLFIVAAGPSLDKNFQQLKNVGDSGIILATGTVFRKLLTAGITPNFVIVSDANPRVYHQIAGLEASEVPMLFLSTAYKGFAKNYKGRKYMICQKDYDMAERFAAERGAMLFSTGGSVSTTALDIGITLGCKRIIFLGLDLAFTDNYVHASGTSRRNLTDSDDLRQVTDVFENSIYTSRSLDIYRNWIENRIQGVKDIEFIDATEGGAKIAGMKIMKLSECINE